LGCVVEFVGQNGPPARPILASLMGQNGAPPLWLWGMMSFSLWTMDCRASARVGPSGHHLSACIFRRFRAKNRVFPAIWSWRSPTDSAEET
jgi:hypothetical protein